MTITQHGLSCDVCGEYILPGLENSFERFSVTGISGELHCHNDEKAIVLEAMTMKDWKLLPEGPLRMAYEEAAKEDSSHAK